MLSTVFFSPHFLPIDPQQLGHSPHRERRTAQHQNHSHQSCVVKNRLASYIFIRALFALLLDVLRKATAGCEQLNLRMMDALCRAKD